jgi:hypothetical protein
VAPRWRHVASLQRTEVYENLRALPRAWSVSEVIQLGPDEVLGAIRTSLLPGGRTFSPAATALVETPPALARPAPAAVRVISVSDERMALDVVAEGEAFVVVADTFYPGWRANIDGRDTPVIRTDFVLRGLVVPAGTHRVELSFTSTPAVIGRALAALAAVALALWWGVAQRLPER